MVEYLTINDTSYPVIINFFVIGEFQKETGYSFDSLKDLQNNLYLVEPLLYHSIRVGQIVSRVPVTITREDMPILLSDNKTYENFFTTITKFFPEQTEKVKATKKK